MKLFIGPMSKNVVDAAIEFEQENRPSDLAGFIPSRRQVEASILGCGYVCNWTTEKFIDYVVSHDTSLRIIRDHGGPGQGSVEDDGLDSLTCDVKSGIKCIHIDPWKMYRTIEGAAMCTISLLNHCHLIDSTCMFEIGTEEGIRRYTPEELDEFITLVEAGADPSVFDCIIYAVVQSGTNVNGMANTGHFDANRSAEMAAVCHKHGLEAKEHNSDYLTSEELKARADCGVDAFNIAPEFGVLETEILIDMLRSAGLYDELNEFIRTCIKSGKWERWASFNRDFISDELGYLTTLCGHYNFETDSYRNARRHLIKDGLDFDTIVKDAIKQRIGEIVKG